MIMRTPFVTALAKRNVSDVCRSLMVSRLRVLVIAGVLAVAALPSPADAKEDPAGFGDSLETPDGEPFRLPEGLELTIISYNHFDTESSCKRPDAPAEEPPLEDMGLGLGEVPLCFQFRNATDQNISVRLPPGLILVSENRKFQNGLLVQSVELEVPSNQYLFAPIKTDCMNSSRNMPGLGFPYTLGPVTRERNVHEVLDLLADRDLSGVMDAVNATGVLKPTYKGRRMDHGARDDIAALPARRD